MRIQHLAVSGALLMLAGCDNGQQRPAVQLPDCFEIKRQDTGTLLITNRCDQCLALSFTSTEDATRDSLQCMVPALSRSSVELGDEWIISQQARCHDALSQNNQDGDGDWHGENLLRNFAEKQWCKPLESLPINQNTD